MRILSVLLALLSLFVKFPSEPGAPVYSRLDRLGRAGPAVVCLSPETLQGDYDISLSGFTPTGYRAIKWRGAYLFHRCHLIGAQLAPGTEVVENLVTGTRNLNLSQMEVAECAVAKYVRETGHHVLYAVRPEFVGDDLLCRGVTIMAWSLEDAGCRMYVSCVNAQDDLVIDYASATVAAPGSVRDEHEAAIPEP